MRNLVLIPLYYLVFVPICLVIVLVHDPLRRSWLPAADNYWYYRPPSEGVTGDGARAFDAPR
ncbi:MULTISPECIES: hypothetical protein [Streptomyces]|uniref:hypothetical protein n=1 Tax=Streptomyces TaxID=1883 RepID=UPI0033D27FC6